MLRLCIAISCMSAMCMAQSDSSGDGIDSNELDDFLNSLSSIATRSSTTSTPLDSDSADQYGDADEQLDQQMKQQSKGQEDSHNDSDALTSTQLGFVVLLSVLIVIALGVTVYFLNKTRQLKNEALLNLVQNDMEMDEMGVGDMGIEGTSYASSEVTPRGAWTREGTTTSVPAQASRQLAPPSNLGDDLDEGEGELQGLGVLIGTTDV